MSPDKHAPTPANGPDRADHTGIARTGATAPAIPTAAPADAVNGSDGGGAGPAGRGPSHRRGGRLATAAAPARRRWRWSAGAVVPAVLALAGMLSLAYPSAAGWISQYNQSQVVAGYLDEAARAEPDQAIQLEQAHAYNQALSSGAVLEANRHVPTGAGRAGGQDAPGLPPYHRILDANGAGLMARLRIPAIDLDLPVYHGTDEDTLLTGLGHLEGTSLPVGGIGTRSVITGHRGLADAVLFTHLDQVRAGETFTLEVMNQVLTYRVVDTKVVAPEQTEELRADPERDLMTLVTCTPLGINTHRILVTGERVEPTPAEDLAAAGARPEVPRFPWWAVLLGLGIIADGVYVWRAGCTGGRAPIPGREPMTRASSGPPGRRRRRDTPERVDRVGGLTGRGRLHGFLGRWRR